MYRPAAFRSSDEAVLRLVDEHPLAQLVVADASSGALLATPVPLIRRGGSLVGHLARPNDVWRAAEQGPVDALAIFTGVDAYVSPRWYPGKAVDGKVVPTWNYSTVHAHGRLVAHDDPAWTLQVVTDLTDRFEAVTGGERWSVSDAPESYVSTMLRGIVGIELTDLVLEGKDKLSQNRAEADQDAVAAGLRSGSPGDRAVADAMRR